MDRYSQSGQNSTPSSSAYHRTIAGPSFPGDIRHRSGREGYESFRRGHVNSRGRYHPHRSLNAEQRDDGETLLDFLRRESVETGEEETCHPSTQGRHPGSPTYTGAPGYSEGSDARKRRLTAPESPARRSGHGPPNTGSLRMPPGYLPTYPPTTDGIQQLYSGESSQGPPAMNPSNTAAQGPSEGRPAGSSFPESSALECPSGRLSSDVVLPPWQPDHDVSKCPICGTFFGLFYRRHHCRKCGRVVCANCSPHRITIPRQFVVHPPSPTSNDFGDRDIIAGGSTSTTDPFHNPSLGGGDEVRVCNPCVPDPNLSPPPQQRRPDDTSAFPDFFGQHQGNLHSIMSQGDGHSQNSHPRASLHRPSHSISGPTVGLPNSQGRPRIWPDSDGFYRAPSHSSRNSTSDLLPSSLPPVQRHHQMHRHSMRAHYQAQQIASMQQRQSSGATPQQADPFKYPGNGMARPGLSFSNAPYLPPPSQPVPAPRRQIPEEDECPICQQELPSKGPDDDETDREAHVMECIASNFVPSSTPAGTATAAPPPSITRDATVAPSVPSPSQAAVPVRSSSMNDAVRDRGGSSSRPRRQTTNRMLVYRATEKDCVGKDGDTQECIICFEEFEEGDEMGRLECLCKFHRACIRSWWETKGPGSCPTHQLHD